MWFRSGGVEKRAASPTVINPIIETIISYLLDYFVIEKFYIK